MPLGRRLFDKAPEGDASLREQSAPVRFAKLLAALGPTYIKLGQILSMRKDLFAPDWISALETLQEVKARGYSIGLISMCAPDTPEMWRSSELASFVDVEVFSSETGLRKPERAIYLYACERLGVVPERCLYCGDGAYAELTGAAALGMTAVEIRDPNVVHAEQLRPEGEDWDGERVADLRELLEWLPPR